MTKVRLIRDVTLDECPWLKDHSPESFVTGAEFYIYEGYTYGCIGPNGKAVCFEPNKNPFLEIPSDSFEIAESEEV
jgi:hypothetical protein